MLQLLFQEDLNPGQLQANETAFFATRLDRNEDLIEFARSLLDGVLSKRHEIDAAIADAAENWTVRRMGVTDRNALRLGTYEMLFTDSPKPVVINEAVELAKRFGNEHSGPFVNGILDRLAKQHPLALSNSGQ